MLGEQFTSMEAREDEVCCFLGVNRRHDDGDGFMCCRQGCLPSVNFVPINLFVIQGT